MAELSLIGLNASPLLGGQVPLATTIAATAAAGFPLIGLDTWSVQAWAAAGGDLSHLRDALAEHGLRCWELAPLCIRADPGVTASEARDVLEIVRALEIPWVVVNVHATESAAALRSFADVAAMVQDAGSSVALEYVAWHPVDTITRAMPYLERAPVGAAGLLVDTWHHFRGPESTDELEALPVDCIAYAQFDDARPPRGGDVREDSVRDRTFPGEGVFDLAAWSACLQRKGFDGVVSVEVLDERWRTPEADQYEFARRAYEATRAFWP